VRRNGRRFHYLVFSHSLIQTIVPFYLIRQVRCRVSFYLYSIHERSTMRFSYTCAVLALSAFAASAADDKSKEKPFKPCTIRSPSSGAFFDINPLQIHPPNKESKSKKDDHVESWHAKGYDYGHNFTMNFCGPVVEELDYVEGVSSSLWKNVSAFYTVGSKTYSIGYASRKPL